MKEGQGVAAASMPVSGTDAGDPHVRAPEGPAGTEPRESASTEPRESASTEPREAEATVAGVSVPENGAPEPGGTATEDSPAAVSAAKPGPAHARPPAHAKPADEADEPHARVDARRLESALLALRHQIMDLPLIFETPELASVRAERRKLLSQIDDYLLPRLRQSEAPILVALVGSTGAGKSTLMNSLVGMKVSQTGIRRPTTNSPVLACHPDDARWFAENVFLPTLPRVRQEGLAMPGRDGLLVLAASEGMPRGVALLDTPDIDSVVQAHREFAHQFLDASDLWLFMTSSRRYADSAVWELLKQARDRGAALAIVLSRVPEESARPLTAHFDAMLAANGLSDARRFMIAETVLDDEALPPAVYRPVRKWLDETAVKEERRVAVLTQTMSGMLDTFRERVPALAEQAQQQLTVRAGLSAGPESAYAAALTQIAAATADGSLLRGEILARWQEFAGTGDLMRMLESRRTARAAGRQRRRKQPSRAKAVEAALRGGLETLMTTVADRAAETAMASWQRDPAGSALLEQLEEAGQNPADATFAELGFAPADSAAAPGAARPPARPPVPPSPVPPRPMRPSTATLARSSPDLATRTARAVSAWQDQLAQLIKTDDVAKRAVAKLSGLDTESVAIVLAVALLGQDEAAGGAGSIPLRILTGLFGSGLLGELSATARRDLLDRAGLLLEEEARRFQEVVDAAGELDKNVAVELNDAAHALEGTR